MQFDVVRPQHPGVIASRFSVGWLRHTKRRRTQNGEEYRAATQKHGPNASTLILRYTGFICTRIGRLRESSSGGCGWPSLKRGCPIACPAKPKGLAFETWDPTTQTIGIVIYWAVVAVATTCWMEAACTAVTVDLFTMDFSINPAREGRQTQKSFPEL
jgi:hypothetical protein